MGSELWWPFHKCCQVGGCSASLQNFFSDTQDHHEAHTRALEQSEQPFRVCFTTKVMYCRIFCLKVVVKFNISTWFLTKKYFFTFDFRMMNFTFLWPRNEIWKRFFFLEASKRIGGKLCFSFEKKWILLLKPSFLLVFTYTERFTRWGLSCGGLFRSPITSRVVWKPS